jgi:hypothetical protein
MLLGFPPIHGRYCVGATYCPVPGHLFTSMRTLLTQYTQEKKTLHNYYQCYSHTMFTFCPTYCS